MANLKLRHIYKVYPNGLKAVSDFTMDIDDKEFIVFVGPSGCGKSTTLRMIAGLEEITAGELLIGDKPMNDVEPKDRDIAMVFQNYALYPHFTVYENMAFGLKLRKLPKDEIDRRVREAADILGISEYLNKKPKEMSGGQRQRVALGRAIVREPKVFLLDEPLSNLDAKLRTQMRAEISKLHKKLNTTFIYVTHDQTEAMTMGTRIVVMKDGYIQQVDTPRNLYSYPCNKFVAGFIGTPQMNFFAGRMKLERDKVRITFDGTALDISAPYTLFAKTDMSYLSGEKPVIFGIRAEHISVDENKYPYKAECAVSYVEDLGVESQVYADFNCEKDESILDTPTKVVIKAPVGVRYGDGDKIKVSLDLTFLQIFDAETEESVSPRVPKRYTFDCKVQNGILSVLGGEIPLPPALLLSDGDYTVEIPQTALSFGGGIKVEKLGEEDINGVRLVCVKAENRVFFVIAGAVDRFDGVKIDLRMCGFYRGGSVVAAPMPEENRIGCTFKKKNEVAIEETELPDGKIKRRARKLYFLDADQIKSDCSAEIAQKVLNGAGKLVFKDELELVFSPFATVVSEYGALLPVEQILDYGKGEVFAKCLVGDKSIYVSVPDGFAQSDLLVDIDVGQAQIYDKTIEMRLV